MGIGDELRKAREKQNLTVTGAARLAGLSRQTIYDIDECVGRSRLDTVCQYAAALGLGLAVVEPDD